MKTLKTPLKLNDVRSLKCGDVLYLTGVLFTARDGAHRRMVRARGLPFNLKKSFVVFHAGPIMKKERGAWKTVALGPTTSSRMDPYTPRLIKRLGMRAIIGKGGMSEEVAEEMKKGHFTKPLVAYIAGAWAPEGMRFSHASSIIEHGTGSATSKIGALKDAGAYVVEKPAEIVTKIKEVLKSGITNKYGNKITSVRG